MYEFIFLRVRASAFQEWMICTNVHSKYCLTPFINKNTKLSNCRCHIHHSTNQSCLPYTILYFTEVRFGQDVSLQVESLPPCYKLPFVHDSVLLHAIESKVCRYGHLYEHCTWTSSSLVNWFLCQETGSSPCEEAEHPNVPTKEPFLCTSGFEQGALSV